MKKKIKTRIKGRGVEDELRATQEKVREMEHIVAENSDKEDSYENKLKQLQEEFKVLRDIFSICLNWIFYENYDKTFFRFLIPVLNLLSDPLTSLRLPLTI